MNKLLLSIVLSCSLNSQCIATTNLPFASFFKDYNACFILYSVDQHKIVTEYNPSNYCNERIAPDSSFKVALSLMAFNEHIINQQTVFKWDGQKRWLPTWNQDQTPKTWLQYSAVWVSQRLTPLLGEARIQHYLKMFQYGNQDFSGDAGKHNGLEVSWLSTSLKISAIEQLHFLTEMLSQRLPLEKQAVLNTKKNLYLGKLDNGADYYGKTGAGPHDANGRRDGWFIGFIESGKQQYIFVSNLSDQTVPAQQDTSFGSEVLKPITLRILNAYFPMEGHV